MSFHIKCFFGKHDWEVVNTISERKILESLSGKLAEERLHGLNCRTQKQPLDWREGVPYEQKICLKCCAIKDEVGEYIQEFIGRKIELEFEKFHNERRQKQARSMFEACTRDKFMRI